MELHQAQIHRPYTTLAKWTLIGLMSNVLAYASEFIWLGQLDFEVSIVVTIDRESGHDGFS